MADLATPALPPLPGSVYPPAEDSHLLLAALAAPAQRRYLAARFHPRRHPRAPLALDVGTGSGLALAFLAAHARALFGRADVLALGVDVSPSACAAAGRTARAAGAACCLGTLRGDLAAVVRAGTVDVLVCNPPYVPTEDVPPLAGPPSSPSRSPSPPPAAPAVVKVTERSDPETAAAARTQQRRRAAAAEQAYARESHALAATWSGGFPDGMAVTARLLGALPRALAARGCAYVLLCARNGPEGVVRGVRRWGRAGPPGGAGGGDGWWRAGAGEPEPDGEREEGRGWDAEIVAESGRQGGWERLVVVRIARRLREEQDADGLDDDAVG